MPANPDPVEQVTGLSSGDDVSKTEFVAYQKTRSLGVFASCAEVRNTDLSARTRIIAGSRFFRKDTEDTSADDGTEATLVIIDGAGNHWPVIEGERYDLPWSSSGQMGASETLPAIAVVTPLTLPAGLPGSVVCAAETVPTNDFTVTWQKSTDFGATWSTVFTATILAGEREGAFTLAADATIPAEALLRPVGPASADATVEGFTATIAALR